LVHRKNPTCRWRKKEKGRKGRLPKVYRAFVYKRVKGYKGAPGSRHSSKSQALINPKKKTNPVEPTKGNPAGCVVFREGGG